MALYNGTIDNDDIKGKGDSDIINGFAGNDGLKGLVGNDSLYGGIGNDTLLGGVGNDLLEGGADNDSISGGADADTVSGGEGSDNIEGNGGDDDLFGDAGDDTMLGGEGNDHLDGGEGNDELKGLLGNDSIYGGIGNDTVLGGTGNDLLEGGADNDSISGGADADTVSGGEGADSIEGSSGDDDLFGDAGDDTVLGGGDNDNLDGGDGDDRLDGGRNDDRITAGKGNDTIIGGVGNDTFIILDDAGSQSVITDFSVRANSADILDLSRFQIFRLQDVNYTQNGRDLLLNLGDGQSLTLKNTIFSQLNNSNVLFNTSIPTNVAPEAFSAKAVTGQNSPVKGMLTASDSDNNIVSFMLADNGAPAFAESLEISSNGIYTYTPKAGFIGRDSFTFKVTDSAGETDTATIEVTVASDGNDFRVMSTRDNNDFADYVQGSNSVSGLKNGGFVAVLAETRYDGIHFYQDIYGQILSADGTKIGGKFLVNTLTDIQQDTPKVITLDNGNFVVAWTSYDFGFAVRAQIFSPDGAKIGNEFIVNPVSEFGSFAFVTSICSLSNGGFAVAYSGGVDVPGIVQIYDANGTPSVIPIIGSWNDGNIRIAELENGGFVVAFGRGGSPNAVLAQAFTNDGHAMGNEITISGDVLDSYNFPNVHSLSNGNFVISWQNDRYDNESGGVLHSVHAQIFTPDGTAIGEEIIKDTPLLDSVPIKNMVGLENGGFAFLWKNTFNTLHGQLYDAEGNPVGGGFAVEAAPVGSMHALSVSTLEDGGFVVTWQSAFEFANGESPAYAVRGSIFNADGTPRGLLAEGGSGNDAFAGSDAGQDTFIFKAGHGADWISHFQSNGDLIDLTAFHTTNAVVTSHMSAVDADGDGNVDDLQLDLTSIGGGTISILDLSIGSFSAANLKLEA